MFFFLGEEMLFPRITSQLEDHLLSTACYCLLICFQLAFMSGRRFLHPQPEDDPCRGDRSPHNMENGVLCFSVVFSSLGFISFSSTVVAF